MLQTLTHIDQRFLMNYLSLVISAICLISSASFAAGYDVYKLNVERSGLPHLLVAGNFWQGEYPHPVIDVHSQKAGLTTIQGWASLRKLEKRQSCTIKNGLYHPWAHVTGFDLGIEDETGSSSSSTSDSTQNSVITYYTIAPVLDYKVTKKPTKDIESGFYNVNDGSPVDLRAGDQIIKVIYLSEGISAGVLVRGSKTTQIELYSDLLDASPEYFLVTQKTEPLAATTDQDGTVEKSNEQWLYLACSEGYNVFVQDIDLLSQPGIKEGVVAGFGEIEAAP